MESKALLLLLLSVAFVSSGFVKITNGKLWYDTNGNVVQAHGPGFIKVNDTWYMIGEDRSKPSNPDVNMYSTKDFITWKFERKIIENNVTHPDLGTKRFIERPKIMYNSHTKRYVVWCHWEAPGYGASEAAVFYSDTINGRYTYHWSGRPLGIKSRDCNAFVDDDGTGYFVSTTEENTNLGFFLLADDYLSAVGATTLFKGMRREAPAFIKVDKIYYMLSSACTGWDPNQCKLSHSNYFTKDWSNLVDIGDSRAFDTQPASIIKIQGTKTTTYLYVGDRWMDPDLPNSKTIMFPVTFHDGKCDFVYRDSFEIDFETGEVRY